MTKETWAKRLNPERRKRKGSGDPSETRTEIERDYDRVLFSSPVRRLADKTQVFPMEVNDSVRNRLTHSHEVSNLARSIGVTLVHEQKIGEGVKNVARDIPALLATTGLAHDLGNPPFGHQGEEAIRTWFKKNKEAALFENGRALSDEQATDFLKFEGNAQAFPVGHFKFPHLWPPKLPQAGRADYQLIAGF